MGKLPLRAISVTHLMMIREWLLDSDSIKTKHLWRDQFWSFFCGFFSTRILLYFPSETWHHIFSLLYIWCSRPNKPYIFSKPIALPISQVLPSTANRTVRYSPEQPITTQYTPILSSMVHMWPLQPITVRYSPVEFSTAQYSLVQRKRAQFSLLQSSSAVQYSPGEPSTAQCSLVRPSRAQ